MPKLGRPPRQYLLTRTRVGDEAFKQVEAFSGLRSLSVKLGITEIFIGQMLRALGGVFERRVHGDDGFLYIERVERVV